MSTRERALKRVIDKWNELAKGVPDANQAALRMAMRIGATGKAVRQMCDDYAERMKKLAEFAVEQYGWETTHDPWSNLQREKQWQGMMKNWINEFATRCATD
jgi:hypothetical protein